MKKVIIIICCLFLIVGCNKQEVKEDTSNNVKEKEDFVLKKNDDSKDYVYFEIYKQLPGYDGSIYNLEIPIINIQSDEVDNVNLELKSFVVNSFKDYILTNDIFSQGNVISYDYFITDDYISIIQRYYFYVDGMLGEEKDNVYVVSLKDGMVLSNSDILDAYGYDEENLFKILENKIESDDVAYSLMNIKNEGYKLYVNKSKELCIIYYEYSDDEEIRKELVLN